MKIKNIGAAVRTVSHDGVDRPLTPGAWVDVPLNEDEAMAFRGLGFEVTGEPIKPAAPVKKDKPE